MSPVAWNIVAGLAVVSWVATLVTHGWGSLEADGPALLAVVALVGADVAEIKVRHHRGEG